MDILILVLHWSEQERFSECEKTREQGKGGGSEESLEDLEDSVAHFLGLCSAAKVSSAELVTADIFGVEDLADGIFDLLGGFRLVKRVAEQHGDGQNRTNRVSDTLAGNIGRRAVDGLVEAVALAFAVRQARQARRRKQSQRTGDDGRFIGQDIAEHVLSQNDTVQLARIGDHDHRGRVNETMVYGNPLRGELRIDRVLNDLPPEPGSGEHIGLVNAVQRSGWVALQRQVGTELGNALDVEFVVYHSVEGGTI